MSDTPTPRRWEYSISRFLTDTAGTRDTAAKHADRMGAKGWEMVSATIDVIDGRWTQFWWKREVANAG